MGKVSGVEAVSSSGTKLAHAPSWYATSLPEKTITPLQGQQRADVLVIGAGLAGLSTALELARAGVDVALVEARQIGWGASGRNGGFVSPGFAEGILALEGKLGRDHTQKLYALSKGAVSAIRGEIAGAGREDLIGGTGWLKLVRHEDPNLRTRFEVMTAHYGATYQFLTRPQVQQYLTTERYFQGLLDDSAFHVDPLGLSRLYGDLAADAGARLFEGSPVLALEETSGGYVARLAGGSLTAGKVVIATSAYGGIAPLIDRAVLPVATYVVTTEKLGARLGEAVRFGGCIGDTRRASDYYRVVDGDRLLWGGRITTRVSEPANLAEDMKRDILDVYPQLGDFSIEHVWSGLMGYSVHKMPLIGELKPGFFVATSFGGHGLNTTVMAGKLVGAAIAAGDDQWKLFSTFKPRWGGGVFGRIATQLAYWRLQMLDRVEEKKAMATLG